MSERPSPDQGRQSAESATASRRSSQSTASIPIQRSRAASSSSRGDEDIVPVGGPTGRRSAEVERGFGMLDRRAMNKELLRRAALAEARSTNISATSNSSRSSDSDSESEDEGLMFKFDSHPPRTPAKSAAFAASKARSTPPDSESSVSTDLEDMLEAKVPVARRGTEGVVSQSGYFTATQRAFAGPKLLIDTAPSKDKLASMALADPVPAVSQNATLNPMHSTDAFRRLKIAEVASTKRTISPREEDRLMFEFDHELASPRGPAMPTRGRRSSRSSYSDSDSDTSSRSSSSSSGRSSSSSSRDSSSSSRSSTSSSRSNTRKAPVRATRPKAAGSKGISA